MRQTRFLAAVAFTLLAGFAYAQEKIDNPEFANWSKFKKGTSVTIKTTTDAGGMKSESTITTTLVETGTDKHVVEMAVVSKFNGMEFKAEPMKRDVPKTIELPKDVKKETIEKKKPEGVVEEGTETIKVAGAEFKTKWYKTKMEVAGMKIESKMWMSDDVPGYMVKGETTTTGAVASSIKIELVEFKKP